MLRFDRGYTLSVTRKFYDSAFLLLLAGALAFAQDNGKQPPKKQQSEPKVEVQEPPEEDGVAPGTKEFGFNPLQAKQEMKVGEYYFKKGKYIAAAGRFSDATKWNPGFAEAYLRLGETKEKLHDKEGAKEAFSKYLELEPDGKEAALIKKKLGTK